MLFLSKSGCKFRTFLLVERWVVFIHHPYHSPPSVGLRSGLLPSSPLFQISRWHLVETHDHNGVKRADICPINKPRDANSTWAQWERTWISLTLEMLVSIFILMVQSCFFSIELTKGSGASFGVYQLIATLVMYLNAMHGCLSKLIRCPVSVSVCLAPSPSLPIFAPMIYYQNVSPVFDPFTPLLRLSWRPWMNGHRTSMEASSTRSYFSILQKLSTQSTTESL